MIKEGKQQKKISFFVIDYTFDGGVERVTADLIQLFKKNNLMVNELVSLYASKQKPVIDYKKDLLINILNPKSKKDLFNTFQEYFRFKKPDIFIFQGDNMTISLAILKAAKKAGVKSIPQYHGSVYAYLKKYSQADKSQLLKKLWSKIVYPFKLKKVEKFIGLAENGVVCVSEGAKKELQVIFGEKKTSKVTTIYNPVFLSDTAEVTSKEKVISFVSRLESKHKNAFLIIKAWNLISKNNKNWKLHIYGEGSLKEKMKKFCVNNQLNNVVFKGFVTNIREELSKTIISVSTSNCEGFSMAIAEAILAKNAIVSTNSDGGIKDMLIHNETALLSLKNDHKALANNIQNLIDDERLREDLCNNAIENLNKIVSVSIFDQWKKVF